MGINRDFCCWGGECCSGGSPWGEAVGWFGAAGLPLLSCLAAPVSAWVLAHSCCGCGSQSRQPLVLSLCPAVYARDAGLPPSLTKATVWIIVGDENDHAPHLESESCFVEVPENQSRVALYTLRATDPDAGENGRLEYRVAGEMRWGRGTGQGLLRGLPWIWGHQLQQFHSTSVLSCSKLHSIAAISQLSAPSKEPQVKIWTGCTAHSPGLCLVPQA